MKLFNKLSSAPTLFNKYPATATLLNKYVVPSVLNAYHANQDKDKPKYNNLEKSNH